MTVVSIRAFLSNSHQAVPSAALVVWTQDLWPCRGTAQCLGVGYSQKRSTLAEIAACMILPAPGSVWSRIVGWRSLAAQGSWSHLDL